MRTLARRAGLDSRAEDYYVRSLISMAEHHSLQPMGKGARVWFRTNRPDISDGLIEHVIEFVTGATAGVARPAWPPDDEPADEERPRTPWPPSR